MLRAPPIPCGTSTSSTWSSSWPTRKWSPAGWTRPRRRPRAGNKRFLHEVEVFQGLLAHLNEGNLARTYDCSDDDRALIATSDLLTLKKTIYAANLSESQVNEPEASPYFRQVQELANREGSQVLPISAKLEADIAELDDPEEKAMFMEELGLVESGLDRLIRSSYALLGLVSFLTAGSDECRAWTIHKGTKAPRPPERSTPTSSVASSGPRSSPSRISRPAAHVRRQSKGPGPQRGQGIRHAGRRYREFPL